MRPFIAILSFIILALTNPVELSSKKSRFLDDASVPFLEAKERPSTSAELGSQISRNRSDDSVPLLQGIPRHSTSDAPKWNSRQRKKSEPLPVITLDFYHILCYDKNKRPRVYILSSDIEYPVLTDTTGTKLIGVIIEGHAYSFVIPGDVQNQKVELKIINNVTKETVKVDRNHDPFQGFKMVDFEVYWLRYVRFAQRRKVGPS
ncbi:uncharacterized protein LOC117171690 isoform X1 [Belonocnema kinseyi]|uniref:uncharacterized protein LOC117171690 isoform X1 n=1 Tax=Belonocnema kinseyi TaxID=2817044 RepID=UPI00143DB5C0|nr:uncharacterized protein LOC117171690 isoform X1 [Belonocnema kinseyi]